MVAPGLRGGLRAGTSGYRCLRRSTHRGSLGSHGPPPTHPSSALRCCCLKLSGARNALKNAKEQPPGPAQ